MPAENNIVNGQMVQQEVQIEQEDNERADIHSSDGSNSSQVRYFFNILKSHEHCTVCVVNVFGIILYRPSRNIQMTPRHNNLKRSKMKQKTWKIWKT